MLEPRRTTVAMWHLDELYLVPAFLQAANIARECGGISKDTNR